MRTTKIAAATGLALVLGLTLAGCSPADSSEPTTPDSSTTTPADENTDAPVDENVQVKAPIIIQVSTLEDGVELPAVAGDFIDLIVDSNQGAWIGESSDNAIAEFVPGGEADGAVFNPGVTVLAPGSATITLTDPEGNVKTLVLTITE